jgi:hypothetical protein
MEDIFAIIDKHGQNHLTEHYKSLKDPQQQEAFLEQIRSIDYQQTAQLYKHVYQERSAVADQKDANFKPVANITTHEDLKTQS